MFLQFINQPNDKRSARFTETIHSYDIFTVPTPRAVGYMQKESVELFVYLKIGIWRGPRTNKQYPTPNKYISGRYMPIHGDECLYCLSLFSKIAKFHLQGLAKHFH